jgi:hypothetical protein
VADDNQVEVKRDDTNAVSGEETKSSDGVAAFSDCGVDAASGGLALCDVLVQGIKDLGSHLFMSLDALN